MRSVGAFLGVLALLLQMGVALAHDPAGLGTFAPGLGLPLCHVGGDGAAGSKAPAAPGKAAVCPICLGLAASADLMSAPTLAGIAIAALPQAPPPHPQKSAPQPYARGGPAQPRGPPSLA